MTNITQVTQSSMPLFEDYVNEIRDIWETRWLTNMGSKHEELETRLLDYLKIANITLFTNGHLALECAIAALGIKGEVITTPFSFASTTHAIVRNGLTPVFCDINPEDFTLNVEKIEELITPETSAIIPVHVYGNVCEVDEVQRIANKYNLKVIYDAAHAFGVEINGKGIGTYGDASMFSFHATKVFNTIEGGAISYSDSSLKTVLDQLKNFGITGPETVEYIGGNGKMNEFQAAMGICNIKYVDSEIEKRRTVTERYYSNLVNLEGIRLSKSKEGVKSNYAYFPVVFDGFYKSRDEIYEELKSYGIIARKYFYPLINDFDCYNNKYNSDRTPVAKFVAERVLCLPMFADLELEIVDKICDIITKK